MVDRKPRMRRVVTLLVVAALAAASVAALSGGASSRRAADAVVRTRGQEVVLRIGKVFARLPLRAFSKRGRVDEVAVRRTIDRTLPASAHLSSGHWNFTVAIDRGAVVGDIVRHGAVPQVIDVPEHRIAASVALPVARQLLHNDCESTALSMLLGTQGIHVGQLKIQAELQKSPPLDPQQRGDQMIWGDPELGFVGRADGGGPAGGFGVYTGPVAATAARNGMRLVRSGRDPRSLYEAILAGRAVMAWVGLQDGPYASWQTPAGKMVRVNFNEHSVTLLGIRSNGTLEVGNPLTGRRELWPKARFELMWSRLGGRALIPQRSA